MRCKFIRTTNPSMFHHIGQIGELTYGINKAAFFIPDGDLHHVMRTSWVKAAEPYTDNGINLLKLSTENSIYTFEVTEGA